MTVIAAFNPVRINRSVKFAGETPSPTPTATDLPPGVKVLAEGVYLYPEGTLLPPNVKLLPEAPAPVTSAYREPTIEEARADIAQAVEKGEIMDVRTQTDASWSTLPKLLRRLTGISLGTTTSFSGLALGEKTDYLVTVWKGQFARTYTSRVSLGHGRGGTIGDLDPAQAKVVFQKFSQWLKPAKKA